MKKTLILGASTNPARYSYLVANKLARKGHPIVNVGRKTGKVAGVEIEPAEDIHTDIDYDDLICRSAEPASIL